MPEIVVQEGIVIPESAIETKAARSGGPGGQNVNKVASKIQMWIDLNQITGLRPEQLFRVKEFLKSRLDADGRMTIASQDTRSQWRNREDVAAKVAELIRAALVPPKFRRKTKPTYASKLRKIEEKRHRQKQRDNRRIED
jgi:ribosome-associated protein